MTPDKYTPGHTCPLEEKVKALQTDVREIKGMVGGIYDRIVEVADTADAVYRTVSYHPEAKLSDDDWDFLDEE
jgi:hypothetical protein